MRAFEGFFEGHLEWKKLNQQGIRLLSGYSNSILQLSYAEGEHWSTLADATIVHERVQMELHKKAHVYYKDLDKILDAMSEILAKFRIDLNQLHEEGNLELIKALEEIYAMYEQEFVSRTFILQDLDHQLSRETLVMYIASWQMQSCIDFDRIQEIFDMHNFRHTVA